MIGKVMNDAFVMASEEAPDTHTRRTRDETMTTEEYLRLKSKLDQIIDWASTIGAKLGDIDTRLREIEGRST